MSATSHDIVETREIGLTNWFQQLGARPACCKISQVSGSPRHRTSIGFQICVRLSQSDGIFCQGEGRI